MEFHDHQGFSPAEKPSFPDAEFPLAPASVRDAYHSLWEQSSLTPQQLTAKEHELALTNTLIADFCDEYISAPVYSAAMLGPLADSLAYPESSLDAEQALRQYTNHPHESTESVSYVLGILADRPVIENFWHDTLTEMYHDQPDLLQHLQSSDSHMLSTETWQPHAHLVTPDRTLALLNTVNLESLLIQSVETLVRLSPENVTKDNLTLQEVYRAESFFGPLCEIIGFDGLAMALQSRANIVRSIYTGNEAKVQQAQHIIGERGNEKQVDEDVQSLFSAVFGDHIHEQVIKHTAPHGIIIGEGLCTSKNLRVVWRLKSVGSLARKLDQENIPGYIPMDILGATIIAHNEHEMAERLGRIIERSHNDDTVRLVPTAERTDAVHVKGTPDYIETVREALGFDSIESMRRFVDVKEVAPGEHRVCKVTLVHSQEGRPDLHAEIQLTTEADRIEARIGSAAHLLYKMAHSSEKVIDPSYLAAIRARKDKLDRGGMHLNPASAERAEELYRYLTAA